MPRYRHNEVVDPKTITLPEGVLESDTQYPRFENGEKRVSTLGDYGTLTFYYTAGFGWCITTLGISNGKRGNAARSYGIRVSDGAGVRVGGGPHVLKQMEVHITTANQERLKKYTDLYTQGAVAAGNIRDRISSRRMQGQQMRAEGRRSWRWDV